MQNKPLNIAIIELGSHHEVLWSVYHQCREAYEHTHVLTTRQNHDILAQELKNDYLSSIHIKENKVSTTAFMDAVSEVLSNCQHILITTVLPKDYQYFCQWEARHRSLLLLHDLHFHFASDEYKLSPVTPRQVVELITYKVGGYQRLASLLALQYRCLVCSESVLQYARAQHYESVVDYIDLGYSPTPAALAVSHDSSTEVPKDSIVIVIAGSISCKRRNYQPVLKALSQTSSDTHMTITLAGRAESLTDLYILDNFKQLARANLEVISYAHELSHETYLRCLAEADYLLLPIRPHKEVSAVRECYGHSTHSGALHDVTRYGTKAIISAHYPIQSSIANLMIPYRDSESLTTILNSCQPQKAVAYQYKSRRSILELFRHI